MLTKIFLDKMEDLLNDVHKPEKINLNNDGFLRFAVNQTRQVNIILNNLVLPHGKSEEARRSLKLFGTRQGVMYGSSKVYKDIVDNCSPIRPILSAINTPTYKLQNFKYLSKIF